MSTAIAPDGTTVAEAVAAAAAQLAQAGVGTPRLDAQLLLGAVLGLDRSGLLTAGSKAVTTEQGRAIAALMARRHAREPVSRITGSREFWGLPFLLGPDTLDPRPDTETVVAAALAFLKDRAGPVRIVDLGTGTGCILMALLHERPDAVGLGIDLAPGAVAIARRNAARLGLSNRAAFAVGDWLSPVADGLADLIVANPPYIPRDVIPSLEPEVSRYDPIRALDGGPDGLEAYRRLGPDLVRALRPDGKAFLEIGEEQDRNVTRILHGGGMNVSAARQDLSGTTRCLECYPNQLKKPMDSERFYR